MLAGWGGFLTLLGAQARSAVVSQCASAVFSLTVLLSIGSPSGGAPKLQYFSSYTSDLSDSSDLGVELRSNVAFFGAIYAPGAAVEINSHARIYGSVSGKQVFVDSNAKIHYDEDLANVSTDSSPASRFKVDVLRTIR